jgi:hypothetical protein
VNASPAWDATPPFCFARDGGGRRTEPSNSAIDDAVKHQVAGSSPAGGAKINTLEPSALWPRLESATFMLSSCSRREATRPAKVTFCSTTVFLSTSWIRPRYSEKRPYSSILSSYIEKVRTKKGPSDIVNRDLAKEATEGEIQQSTNSCPCLPSSRAAIRGSAAYLACRARPTAGPLPSPRAARTTPAMFRASEQGSDREPAEDDDDPDRAPDAGISETARSGSVSR